MTVEEWLNDSFGEEIWHKKYQHNNETFDEWLDRVSAGNKKARKLIAERKLLLGGRAMANRGTETKGSLMNCYSRGYVEDSYSDIMTALYDLGMTFKGQGGQGVSLTKLRPKGTPITNGDASDGVTNVMRMLDCVTSLTAQSGARKGALLISLDALHKDVFDFINIKTELGQIEKANLSLEIDDEFMQAVKKYYDTGEEITIHQKRDYSGHIVEYDIKPIEVFKAMVETGWDWGEPGVIFTNKFRNYNIMQYHPEYKIITANPCGEQPLSGGSACCLSSINLSEFVSNPYTERAYFDMFGFMDAVRISVEVLNELVDENYNRHPLEIQKQMSYNYRNIGLGVCGYADMLIKLGMAYGSEEAISFSDELFRTMFRVAVQKSSDLAKQFGSFPKYDECVWESEIIKNHFDDDEIEELKEQGLRNCSLLSIAPTGSISSLLSCGGGTEPLFAIKKYNRRTVGMSGGKDEYHEICCKVAKEYMEVNHTNILPSYFVASHDIGWQERTKTQGIIQKHIDTGISSTVNFGNNATVDDIAQTYISAWENGCKGITVFRDGCKRAGILTTDSTPTEQKDDNLKRGDWKQKPVDTIYYLRKLAIGCGKLKLFIGWSESEKAIQDLYVIRSGNGGCERLEQSTAITMSAILRLGGKLENIEKAFRGVGTCSSFASAKSRGEKLSKGNSCGMVIFNALKDFEAEMLGVDSRRKVLSPQKKISVKTKEKNNAVMICPECGEKVFFTNGCVQCNCGWSKCE